MSYILEIAGRGRIAFETFEFIAKSLFSLPIRVGFELVSTSVYPDIMRFTSQISILSPLVFQFVYLRNYNVVILHPVRWLEVSDSYMYFFVTKELKYKN